MGTLQLFRQAFVAPNSTDAIRAGHASTHGRAIEPANYAAISLVHILNCCRTIAPKEVVKAVSAASRPWAMTMRPMRG